MRPATIEDLGRDPVGRYVVGPTFLHFCLEPRLWGVLLWGRPGEDDAFSLGRSLVLELRSPAVPHASIVDASRLEGGDERAFEALQRYVTTRGPSLAEWVTRLALVRPGGLRGALVSGAYEVMSKPYPVAVFDRADAALEWLGAGAAAQRFADLAARALATSPLLESLRAHLEGQLAGASLRSAARALGVSERSLQRRLAELGTGFQAELGDARVRAAQRRLLDGDEPLTAIALDVGCASLQHLSGLFRRRTGVSPSGWRARERARR